MARSVVYQGGVRCPFCRLSPRWCVCPALGGKIESPLAVDVVQHSGEAWKPTSSAHLIARQLTGARVHVWNPQDGFDRAVVERPGYERWLLHPKGEDWPAVRPERLQLVLLDGTWMQAGEMLRALDGFGRRVSLTIPGESRFWLRTQHAAGHVSTLEALLAALDVCGAADARERLNLDFEAQIYGALRARGRKALAGEFLATSRVREALTARLRALPYFDQGPGSEGAREANF